MIVEDGNMILTVDLSQETDSVREPFSPTEPKYILFACGGGGPPPNVPEEPHGNFGNGHGYRSTFDISSYWKNEEDMDTLINNLNTKHENTYNLKKHGKHNGEFKKPNYNKMCKTFCSNDDTHHHRRPHHMYQKYGDHAEHNNKHHNEKHEDHAKDNKHHNKKQYKKKDFSEFCNKRCKNMNQDSNFMKHQQHQSMKHQSFFEEGETFMKHQFKMMDNFFKKLENIFPQWR
jgi:hypothetical protein